jgi:hypothetical protein
MWVNQKQYDDKITLLTDKGMSSDLRGKLALHLYKEVVQGVSLFSRVDDTFLSKVCMELQTRVFLPQDWIILKGDIGSELVRAARENAGARAIEKRSERRQHADNSSCPPSRAE